MYYTAISARGLRPGWPSPCPPWPARAAAGGLVVGHLHHGPRGARAGSMGPWEQGRPEGHGEDEKQKPDCPGLGRSLGDGGRSPVVVGQPSRTEASAETLVFLPGGAGPGFVLCGLSSSFFPRGRQMGWLDAAQPLCDQEASRKGTMEQGERKGPCLEGALRHWPPGFRPRRLHVPGHRPPGHGRQTLHGRGGQRQEIKSWEAQWHSGFGFAMSELPREWVPARTGDRLLTLCRRPPARL